MSIKQEKSRQKDLVDDDHWKMKGGKHRCPVPEPIVCPVCQGFGRNNMQVECFACEGTGEVWE